MLRYLSSMLSDPASYLIVFLLALPGRLMAISFHEAAHAFAADRCGDHTARMMGRLTVDPRKHLDLMGTLMMVLVGFGWAKPVPVNPRNFRNFRRDDLIVSLAGVTCNLVLFLISCIVMYTIAGFALKSGSDTMSVISKGEWVNLNGTYQTLRHSGLVIDGYLYYISDVLYLGDVFIAQVYGKVAGCLYQMLMYFALTNFVLAVFNLIPVPPLDGWHVLNDTILRRRSLFARPETARIFTIVLFGLMLTGVTGEVLSAAQSAAFGAVGHAAEWVYTALGIL